MSALRDAVLRLATPFLYRGEGCDLDGRPLDVCLPAGSGKWTPESTKQFASGGYTSPEPPVRKHRDAAFWRNVEPAAVLAGYKDRLMLKRRDNRWWIDVVAVPLDAPSWSSARWARKGVSHYDAETCFRMAVYAMMELDGAPTEAKERMKLHLRYRRGCRIDMLTPFWSLTMQSIERDKLDPPEWITPEAREAWRRNRSLIPHWYHESNPHYRHRSGLFDDIVAKLSGPPGPE